MDRKISGSSTPQFPLAERFKNYDTSSSRNRSSSLNYEKEMNDDKQNDDTNNSLHMNGSEGLKPKKFFYDYGFDNQRPANINSGGQTTFSDIVQRSMTPQMDQINSSSQLQKFSPNKPTFSTPNEKRYSTGGSSLSFLEKTLELEEKVHVLVCLLFLSSRFFIFVIQSLTKKMTECQSKLLEKG